MSWLSTAAVALVAGILGLFAAGVVATFAVDWYQISAFEGGSGFFVVFLALFGVFLGMVVGVVAARVASARQRSVFWNGVGWSALTIVALAVLIAGIARVLADVPPTIDGRAMFLQIELRWPAGQAPSTALRAMPGRVTLGSSSGSVVRASESGPLFTDRAQQVDGSWVMSGEAPVFTERGRRLVMFDVGEETLPAFDVPLPGRPGEEDRRWSAWLPDGDEAAAGGFHYRYRVRLAGESLRVDRVGPFAIDTRVSAYYPASSNGRFPAASAFAVTHRDRPVAGMADVEAVAAIGGSSALLVRDVNDGGGGTCSLIVDRGSAAEVTALGECLDLPGSMKLLTNDQQRFEQARAIEPLSGWVDYESLANPGLYLVSQFVLDTRALTGRRFVYLSGYSPDAVPPLQVSPDERTFVILARDQDRHRPALVAIRYRDDAAYPLAIDRRRMRFNNERDFGPAWVAHHFTWEPSGDGDRLVERQHFVPLPHHGDLAPARSGEYQSYTLRPGGAALRDAITRMLVDRLRAERLPDPDGSYEQRVRLEGHELHVMALGDPTYVSVSMDAEGSDRSLMERVARALDAVLATGELDDLFVEDPPVEP